MELLVTFIGILAVIILGVLIQMRRLIQLHNVTIDMARLREYRAGYGPPKQPETPALAAHLEHQSSLICPMPRHVACTCDARQKEIAEGSEVYERDAVQAEKLFTSPTRKTITETLSEIYDEKEI